MTTRVRQPFLETHPDSCGRTGWEVFAWMRKDKRCHAVFRTSEPTLVAWWSLGPAGARSPLEKR